jgi:hypothetical protein
MSKKDIDGMLKFNLEMIFDSDKMETSCDNASIYIESYSFRLSVCHLGFDPSMPLQEVLDDIRQGARLAEIYFNDTWWRDIKSSSLTKDELDLINLVNRDGLDRSYKKRDLKWYTAFRYGLFLNALLNNWDVISRMCTWFDPTIEPEYQAGQLEDEYMQLFVCIACALSTANHDITELLAKVKKCRTKRPKLLCSAWEAAMNGNQETFNKAFPATIENFLSKTERTYNVHAWLAFDQSAIWMIAEKNGLTMPELSEKMKAAIVTRESIGLA